MKHLLIASCVLLALSATAASAAGINLTWSTGTVGCWPEKVTSVMTWSCGNETDGPWTFVASFKMDAAKTDFIGISAILGGQSTPTDLPDWWQVYNAGSCRRTSVTTSADFTAAAKTVCKDPFAGAATGGITAWYTAAYPPPSPIIVPAPSRFRMKVAFTMATSKTLSATSEWYAFRGMIDAAHTTVTQPLCSGCATTMYLDLSEIGVIGSNSSYKITAPHTNTCIAWQALQTDYQFCNLAGTPVRNNTWGQVKGLYR